MPHSSPQPPLEAAWQTLRSTLEWGDSFELVFVFCNDQRAKQALFERADGFMRAQVRPFQRPGVNQAADLPTHLLAAAINPASVHIERDMPLWLDLDGHPSDPAWNQARQDFLLRLNERRASLARAHKRTVVLALPLDWTKPAAEAAPDLWTIRQPSAYLDTTGQVPVPAPDREPPLTDSLASTRQRELPEAAQRWLASQASGLAQLSLWDAARASDAALATGHTELAKHIAQSSAERARALVSEFGRTPERLRDLSVVLNTLGDVARALGRLEDAQQAYGESEKLRRALTEEFGRTPERLRDLSVALNKRGDVAQALGQLDDAQQAYSESEKLNAALIDELGRTPERLRDLSVVLNKRGEVARALGLMDEAQQAYASQVKLATELITLYGETEAGLDALAEGELRLGQTLLQQGWDDDAQLHCTHAHHLFQRLALARPHDQRYAAALKALEAMISAATASPDSP